MAAIVSGFWNAHHIGIMLEAKWVTSALAAPVRSAGQLARLERLEGASDEAFPIH
jgi:hypothetical protein